MWGGSPTEVWKLELHDYYDVDRELFQTWREGGVEAVEPARSELRTRMAQRKADGWRYRRVRVVSEPLSEYQRMAVEIANPEEELRWLPRPLVSAVPLPGNDCLIRPDLVVFNLLGGDRQQAGTQLSREPDVIRFCRDAFERAWELAIPNGDYEPAQSVA